MRGCFIFGFCIPAFISADDEQLEQFYQRTIKPFIQIIYRYPRIPTIVYISGYVLKFLEKKHVECFDVISEMVKRKSLEILGGGMYEPLASIIPRGNTIDQFEYMTTYIRQNFGKRPRGFVLPGNIWHNSLISLLKRSGLVYTIMDKNILKEYCSVTDRKPASFYVTEYEGETIFILPQNTNLEQYLFKETASEFLQRLIAVSHASSLVTVLCPDISLWNAVSHHWFAEFLALINDTELSSYLPTALLANSQEFVPTQITDFGLQAIAPKVAKLKKSTNCRLAITNIPENRLLYARMQYIHTLCVHLKKDKSRKKTAQEISWPAQSCFAYSSLPSGGVQISAHRKKHYAALIEAEWIIRGSRRFSPSLSTVDYDFDGSKELLYSGYDMSAYIHCRGATLFALDWIKGRWNYMDTMYRCPSNSADDPPKSIYYDSYYRRTFVDHFIDGSETLQRFMRGEFQERGSFVDVPYTQARLEKEKKIACFSCDGTVQQDNILVRAKIDKIYTFSRNTVTVRYAITSQQRIDNIFFVPEMNFSFASCDSNMLEIACNDDTVLSADRGRRISSCKTASFIDKHMNVAIVINFDGADFLWSFPVYSWGYSHGEAQELYQYSCILPCWKIQLKPKEKFCCTISFKLEKLA